MWNPNIILEELLHKLNGINSAITVTFTLFLHFNHLADAFIQRDLKIRTKEVIKTNKRSIIFKCYDKSQLAQHTCRKLFCVIFIIDQIKPSR